MIEGIIAKTLEEIIDSLTIEKLEAMNRSIVENGKLKTLSEMTDEIMEACY